MSYQAVFKRYEFKYMLNTDLYTKLISAISPYMELDSYGLTTIRNIYYDTDNYRLIRTSLEKPVYKEKLRVRSYSNVSSSDHVFVELKKKFEDVVYKRRISLPEQNAMQWLSGNHSDFESTQIIKEIEYFVSYYGTLHPVLFLSYDRLAYYCKDGSDFRVTFDKNIMCRQDRLSLCEEPSGNLLLNDDQILMEIKCSGGIPLWMTDILTRERIYKTSFSKYGTAYQNLIFPKLYGGK